MKEHERIRAAYVTGDMLLIHTDRKPEGLVRVISPGKSLCGPSWHALHLDIPSVQRIKSAHLTGMLSFPLNVFISFAELSLAAILD